MKYWIFRTSNGLNITGNYLVFPHNQECNSDKLLDIILIHAFPFDSSMYFSNLKHELLIETLNQISLEKGKIRVFLPNLPGFGESDPFYKKPKDLVPYVNVINTIVKKFNIQNLIIGGCSIGGYIALEYMRNHVESLKGLILIDTKAIPDNLEQK